MGPQPKWIATAEDCGSDTLHLSSSPSATSTGTTSTTSNSDYSPPHPADQHSKPARRRQPRMCKTKMAIDAAEPIRTPKRSQTPITPPPYSSDPSSSTPLSGYDYASSTSGGFKLSSDTTSVVSSGASLSSLRQSLPENPIVYEFSELRAATNNFLARRHSSTSATASWRCSLRGKDAIVFQRKSRRKIELNRLKDLLGAICRSHLSGIVKLLGASVSGENVYLVYEFVNGACLSDCLLNQRNSNFTVLKTWMSRMQVATDVAHALDYIHNNTGLNISLVHNHVKSSSIMVTEPNFNAKICHIGAAQLCGEISYNEAIGKIVEEPRQLSRSNSRIMEFEGVRGYMSPEFRASGLGTQKSDVYAFGVVILELLSGDEPFKYRFDKEKGDFTRTSVIETARAAVDDGDGGGGTVEGRLRQWVDRRLSDSFPVEAAERLIRVALDCIEEDPEKRPDMARVAGKISKLYVQSKSWSDNFKVPDAISVSFVPR